MSKRYNTDKFLIILISPSGGGKSTILSELVARRSDIEYSISYTTRDPRGEEENGKHYFFVQEEEFLKKIENGDFLEHACVHGKWYGTSRKFIEDKLNDGVHIILDIDVQGAEAIIESAKMRAVTIFLLPPTENIWKQRLIDRGTDTPEQIALRFKNAEEELKKIDNFNYLVINDELDIAVEKVNSIITAEENKTKSYNNVLNIFMEKANA